ncbi:hypothetical protein [Lacrimispora indolis]|uniref:hypothetical protein n=1 Tax=Lacrimispora indolis TaxID=69825 RepID=UPI0012EC82ED|nr:hypothetical protein [[Clostridium] methoxybenzovorans]
MNKMLNNGVKIAIIFGLIISGFILTCAIFSFGSDKKRLSDDEKDEIRQEELRQMVEKHLEDKYGERFIVEEGWHGTAAGDPLPFPKDTGDPWYCIAYAESDLGFGFRVYVYPKVIGKEREVNNVGEIWDGYCWKFLREQIRKDLETGVDKAIPLEYKLVVYADFDTVFDDDIQRDSSIESYIRNADGNKIEVYLYLIIDNDIDLLKDKLYKVLKENYEKYNGTIKFYLICYKTEDDLRIFNEKTMDDIGFTRKETVSSFCKSKWGLDLEILFRIEDFSY